VSAMADSPLKKKRKRKKGSVAFPKSVSVLVSIKKKKKGTGACAYPSRRRGEKRVEIGASTDGKAEKIKEKKGQGNFYAINSSEGKEGKGKKRKRLVARS